jgi:serine/threonine protein kinase/formylglycine-generating enzyme required for sulfatase activity
LTRSQETSGPEGLGPTRVPINDPAQASAGDSRSTPPDALSFFRPGERERPQPAPGLSAGKLVGDFRLVAMLGQGGMGQVWEAEQRSLQRRVAVKFVRPERVTERQLELFAREARAGGRLSHPGIVTVYGHGQSDGLAWIAMEYVEGAWTLEDFLDDTTRTGEVPEGYDHKVALFVARIADAMHAAHEAGVIHRDLKPQNVLITEGDRPKVTDFGLARITDEASLSVTGEFSGTYYYMSPEQVAARRAGIDRRTDVFSLGVVLYELLALRRPFEGDTTHQVAAQILHKDPPDIRLTRSRAPRDLMVIAGKALEKDPDRRFQSMAELAADLRRYLANEPIQARPPTRLDRLVKWTRRNPTRSAALGIASVTFTVIALLLVQNVRTNRALIQERTNLALTNGELGHANEALELKSIEAEQRRLDAERSAREALEQGARAERKTDEVLRLAALQRLDDLTAEADQLWPAHPGNIERYQEWLARAGDLVAELPDHERKLAEVNAQGEEGLAADEIRWWRNQLDKLVRGIRALADEETGLYSAGFAGSHGWGVKRRLANAEGMRDALAQGGRAAQAWTDAMPAIRAAYPGLELVPQMGLLPIGPDPDSGLWEFAQIETGEPAVRRPDGKLVLTEDTGLVLVLLPEGTAWIGAQRDDPEAPNYDPGTREDEGPVHEATLTPFFLSKYEMTQAQWIRLAGSNPSYYTTADFAQSLMNPVEQVSWARCVEVMGWLGLSVPTETQWEYGARAGTTTPWWTGSERESLRGAVNLADQAAARGGAPWSDIDDWPDLDDGFAVHGPVGSFRPNPFGLHDVHGNVWEWCLDAYVGGYLPDDEDPVTPAEASQGRVMRGGCFDNTAAAARSANRPSNPEEFPDNGIGLRPARVVEP